MSSLTRTLRFAVLLSVLLAAPTRSQVTWPTGAAPCNDINDLETCLNTGTMSGDVVEIAANAIPAQSVSVDPAKSLTLRPAAGFTPVFADFSSISFPGADEDITILVEGITIVRGSLGAVQGGSGTFEVTFRNNIIQGTSSSGEAIRISSGNAAPPYGPTIFLVESNQITIDVGADDVVSAIDVGGFQTDGNEGTIAGNVIDQVGGDQAAAIEIFSSVGLEVDVLGNQISGTNFNEGIGISVSAGEAQNPLVTSRIVNNTISGQVDESGQPGGISLSVSRGTGNFTVVNNTVAFNESGLVIDGRADLGAVINGLVANNIVAFNLEQGLSIEDDFAATVANESNLVFGNGFENFVPGPGTLSANPFFVSPTDLRTQVGSPARDTGANARVPPDITLDVAGAARIQGTVDRGAFELGTGLVGTDGQIPTLSTLGLLALVGLIAAVAWVKLR